MFLSKEEKELEYKKNRKRVTERCPICNGTGVIHHTDNMYNIVQECTCMKIVYRNVKLLDWGVPRKFLDEKWNLEMLKDKPYYEIVKNYIDNFDYNYENGRGVFLTGAHGRGKTTVECIIAKNVAEKLNFDTFSKKQNYTVGFAMYDDIVKMQFSKSIQDHEKLKQFLYTSSLLIIDNVGNETGKNDHQFSQRLLEMILRKRDNDCLPTIISSNYNMKEIEQEYNIDVKDFIIQNCDIIYVSGENYRIDAKTEEVEF